MPPPPGFPNANPLAGLRPPASSSESEASDPSCAYGTGTAERDSRCESVRERLKVDRGVEEEGPPEEDGSEVEEEEVAVGGS